MIYPNHRREFTKEQVKCLLEEEAKSQGWKEIWTEDGWDDISLTKTVCVMTNKPIEWTKNLITWAEDYDNEEYQSVFEVSPNEIPSDSFFFVKCIYKEGAWL